MAKVNLPAKVDDMTSLQAISSFNEHETKIFKELSDIVRRHNKDTLDWYWSLGVKLDSISSDAKKNKANYGHNVLGRISVALGFRTSGPLYQAMRVVEAFGTKKAFTEYTKLQGEAGNTLSWGHICMLSGIGDASLRLELAATSLEQGWTVETLGEQVAKLCDRKQRGIRTAKPKTKIPANDKKCLLHVTSQAESFIYSVKTAWTGDAFSLKSRVDDIPASNLNAALLDDLKATRERLSEMVTSACEMDDELKVAEATIARKLKAQADADAAAEEDEPEEEPEEDEEEDVLEDDDDNDVLEDADEDTQESLEDLAGEDDEDQVINIGALHNAKEREKRALARAKERARAARGR